MKFTIAATLLFNFCLSLNSFADDNQSYDEYLFSKGQEDGEHRTLEKQALTGLEYEIVYDVVKGVLPDGKTYRCLKINKSKMTAQDKFIMGSDVTYNTGSRSELFCRTDFLHLSAPAQ